MLRIVKSPLAENDLLDIWDYSYHKWGVDQATAYLLQLDAGINGLLNNPEIGKSCASIRAGYRYLIVDRHLIYYCIRNDDIDIVRVLHDSVLPEKHL